MASAHDALAAGGHHPRTARGTPADGLREPGADLREVRPGAVHPARPAAARYRQRTGPAAGPGSAVPGRSGRGRDRARAGDAAGAGLRRVRPRAHRLSLHCPGSPCPTARRHPGGREGAAPGHAGRDRGRPEPAAHRRHAGHAPVGRRPAAAPHGSGRRVRPLPARRAGPGARGGQRQSAQAQLRGLRAAAHPADVLGLLPPQRAGDGVGRRHPHRPARPHARGWHRPGKALA